MGAQRACSCLSCLSEDGVSGGLIRGGHYMVTGNKKNNNPATFSFQDSLPRLPVPDLAATCEKLLAWNKVLLDEQTMACSREVVADFVKGTGIVLQKRLEERAADKEVKNWLEDFWNESYLAYRQPLCINSNVFYLLDDIPELQGLSQTRIATLLIQAMLDFRQLIATETLAVDMERDQPLCMIQYTKLFATTRIPQTESDIRRNPHCDLFPTPGDARHIIVFYKGHPVQVDVLDENGNPPENDTLEYTLQAAIKMVDLREEEGQAGILTTMDRDSWAVARQKLLELGAKNEKTISAIETALFVVCLDDAAPQTLTETARVMMHGNGNNRWFDKSLQLIVCPNAKYGICAEHSGLDGSVIGRMFRMITESSFAYTWEDRSPEPYPFTLLDLEATEEIRKIVQKAVAAFFNLVADTRVKVLEFKHFGKAGIKGLKVSPDAFVQLAMQRAQHRLFGKCHNVYEPVMTRRYLHGRTEAARTVTPESVAFVEAMASQKSDDRTRAELLLKAAKSHVSRLVEARNGHGVQRHLMGLLKIYQRHGKELGIRELPQLFTDPVWTGMCHDTFSTSTSDPVGLALAGYGPVVDDGFGIRYVTKNDAILFTMSCRKVNEDKLDLLYVYVQEVPIVLVQIWAT